MLAFMLAISPVWTSAAPPESTRIDPIAIYAKFLLSDLEALSGLNETIEWARKKRNLKLTSRATEVRDMTLRSLYDNVRCLLKEIRFQVWYEFRMFVLRWNGPPSE